MDGMCCLVGLMAQHFGPDYNVLRTHELQSKPDIRSTQMMNPNDVLREVLEANIGWIPTNIIQCRSKFSRIQ